MAKLLAAWLRYVSHLFALYSRVAVGSACAAVLAICLYVHTAESLMVPAALLCGLVLGRLTGSGFSVRAMTRLGREVPRSNCDELTQGKGGNFAPSGRR